MSHRGKRYSAELKAEILQELQSGIKSVSELSEAYGITVATLYQWRRSQEQLASSVEQSEHHKLLKEYQQLKKKLTEVEQERDILKKAVAYFAKE